MTTVNAIPITQAAEILKVGSKKLFKVLREKGVLLECNSPAQQYRDRGELQLRFAEFFLPGTRIKKTTPVPYVTPAGWHLLEAAVRDMQSSKVVETPEPNAHAA